MASCGTCHCADAEFVEGVQILDVSDRPITRIEKLGIPSTVASLRAARIEAMRL